MRELRSVSLFWIDGTSHCFPGMIDCEAAIFYAVFLEVEWSALDDCGWC